MNTGLRQTLLLTVALLAGGLALASCGGGDGAREGEPGNEPSTVVAELYKRLAGSDTKGMVELMCPGTRPNVDSGVSLLEAFSGSARLAASGPLELEDFRAQTVASDESDATVKVQGSLLAAPPAESASLDETIRLRLDRTGWCVLDPRVAVENRATPRSPAEIEADPAPDLPGEFVDLQAIYGGAYGAAGVNPTAAHLTRDIDYVADGNSNPPAGGPHWGRRSCPTDPRDAPPFCGPTPWGIFRDPWDPEVLVHNMEHGGVILWYNTTDQSVIDELEALFAERLNRGYLLVMAPYADMEDEHIALTAWARIDKFPVSDYSEDRVTEFLEAFTCRFNPEGFTGKGC